MFKNWLFLILAIFLSIFFCELVVRVRYSYKAPWYEQLITQQREAERRPYRSNKWGLRDRDFEASKPSGCRRILILGDSFTYGAGVDNESDVFPKLLEKMLNQKIDMPGIDKIEVLNGGISGSLTNRWVDLLIKIEDHFQPDVVLVVFFLRDGTLVLSVQDFFNPIRNDIAERNRESILYRYLYIYRFIKDYIDRMQVANKYTQKINQSYLGDKKQAVEWEKAKSNILKIEQCGNKRSAVTGLVVFPILAELNASYPFRAVCNTIMEFAVKNNIPAHSLLPAFMGLNGKDLWVSPYNQHPNEKAHLIAAQSMLPFTQDLLRKAERKRLGE
jgi:lysophospholipase L1-like esterase